MLVDSKWFGVVCIMLFVVGLVVVHTCNGNPKKASDNLRVPLLTGAIRHRMEAASRDADGGFKRCRLCAFDNFRRVRFCCLCGEEVVEELSHMDARKPLPAWSALSQRKRRARLRREWLRRMDAQGNMFWFRTSRTKTTRANTLETPGFTLRFDGGADAGATLLDALQVTAAERTLELTQSQLERLTLVTIELIPQETVPATVPATPAASEPEQKSDLEQGDGGGDVGDSHEDNPERPKALEKSLVLQVLRIEAARQTLVIMEASDSDPAIPTLALSEVATSPADRARANWKFTLRLSARAFPVKYSSFVSFTAALLVHVSEQYVKLNVRRESLLKDSLEALSTIPREHIRSAMRLEFAGEQGVDAGALYREWVMMLNQELVESAHGVFTCVNPAEQVFYLNPQSAHDIGDDHLLYYFGAGRLVGRALLEGQVLGFHLALPLLKLMLGQPVSFTDLEFFDPEAYKSLVWIRENDGVGDLGLTFSITELRNGESVEVDLIDDGRHVDVTDENKELYLERRFRYLLFESVSGQLYAFLKGVYEVVPPDLLALFDPEELDYVLCGSDEIDVDEWRKYTRMSATIYDHPNVIDWFWEIVHEMPNEYRRRLLHFATGTARVPLGGFAALTSVDGRLCPFTLKGVKLTQTEYIASRACFNRLDIPLYTSRTKMERVLLGILETDEFGFTKA